VELSREHGFVIAADEVYQLLWYYRAPPTAFGSMAQGDQGTILSLGSFSKILAPGLRLGWIQTTPDLMEKLLANGVVSSGGSLNHFTSQVVHHAIDLGLQDEHLHKLRSAYRGQLEAMDQALHEQLADMAQWQKPQGGYFFWLQLPQIEDTRPLRKRAEKYQTGFQPGPVFSSHDRLHRHIRLSFAHYREDEIITGISRLAALLRNSSL
jgi:DNA-binding transcriptional MocR family regulator